MADENLRIASDAFNEAQRNVSKAQELVDRYEGKMKEIEEKPIFVSGNTDALYFIERLKDAKELLKEREKSLIVRENRVLESCSVITIRCSRFKS
jgi:flagellar motor protein MotB